ncbi:MAG: hypothetical protein DRR19_15205 [Candidatus Parabeggiatoa sp. nov. 1]|nr:MAG: hypothetical protein DRR19_15205 [Gammaproteobacteria bacterium]
MTRKTQTPIIIVVVIFCRDLLEWEPKVSFSSKRLNDSVQNRLFKEKKANHPFFERVFVQAIIGNLQNISR